MYKLGGRSYKTKAAAQREAKRILNESPLYESIGEQELAFMLDWFELTHEDPARKFGVGVQDISVRMNQNYPTRGFWITRTDGTETDISYLPKKTKRSKVLAALRTAVDKTILEYKALHGVPKNMHVDHGGGWPFSRIVCEFEKKLGYSIEKLKVKPHKDGDDVQELVDNDAAHKFKVFHDKRAKLQHIAAAENLAKGDREKYIGKPLPTEFNGTAIVTSYDTETGYFITSTGLGWQMQRGVLVTPKEDT